MREYMKVSEINAFLRKPCCQPYLQKGYCHPTPDDVKSLLSFTEWKPSFIAELLGVGESTLRKWTAHEESSAHRKIPYSAWRLLLGYLGRPTSREEARKLLLQWEDRT